MYSVKDYSFASKRKYKMIYDLTHEINSEMPVFPGLDKTDVKNKFIIEKDGFAEKSISMMSHTGTHIDAPAHMMRGGTTLDKFDISKFKGKAFLINLEFGKPDAQIIAEIDEIHSVCDYIIFRTGWSKFWGNEKYFQKFPVPSSHVLKHLLKLKLKGIGIDTASIDEIDSTTYENHHLLFSENMIIIENLNNLTEIKTHSVELTALPLLVSDCDGFSARVIAEY